MFPPMIKCQLLFYHATKYIYIYVQCTRSADYANCYHWVNYLYKVKTPSKYM